MAKNSFLTGRGQKVRGGQARLGFQKARLMTETKGYERHPASEEESLVIPLKCWKAEIVYAEEGFGGKRKN